jgi:polysaccharide deacetylase 2 family uncharacterized protein YibQ
LDDLNTPLAAPKTKRRLLPPITAPQLLTGIFGLFLAVFLGWAAVVDDPLGGEPGAVASIPARSAGKDAGKSAEAKSRHDRPAHAGSDATPPAGDGRTVTIIDGTSGKRQQVAIPGPPGEQPAAGARADEQLLEATRHGRIPKVAAGGIRPIEAYAGRAAGPQTVPKGTARVVIVVGGLGISASTTADALSRLPPAVTLAFNPHGANLNDLVARARARGHEALLQVAMEPFDYPDNDPGPQTLLSTLSNEQNLDRLHWQMSRFEGYVGVVNLMGARFTASEKALTPVLKDIVKRGLLFVDDGSSSRSVAGHVAAASNVPFVKSEELLDSVPTPNEIDRALARLEAAARKHGLAVGVAGALPVSIDRIVRWAKGAEGRGIVLVPVTAAVTKPRST